MALKFEYCECGCHCHEAYSKGVTYSLYYSLDKKDTYPFYLRLGSHYGTLIGTYSTFEKAAKATQRHFDALP